MRISELTNYQLAAIAVAILGGDVEPTDREDIAIKLNEIAPGRFNWRKYPERIDLVVVVAALRDAKKSKNGELLVGSNLRGWMLSPAGLDWAKGVDLGAAVQDEHTAEYRRDSVDANLETERARLRTTTAYELFTAGKPEEMSLQDFYRFARVNEYFQTRTRQRRYAVIENAVAGDETLAGLWSWLKEEFPEEMT
jgi:hypothetical protein